MSGAESYLIVDTWYPRFLQQWYAHQPVPAAASYADQWRALMDSMFGSADFYSAGLMRAGQRATEVVLNDTRLQATWAREYAPELARRQPPAHNVRATQRWLLQVLTAQVRWFQPDILYVQDLTALPAGWLRALRPLVGRIVGQTAYPLGRTTDLRPYDLLISSLPNYVARFRRAGHAAAYVKLAFAPQVLDQLASESEQHQAVFVGGLSRVHRDGVQMLETVAARAPLAVWGYDLAVRSPLRAVYRGEAWARDMYQVHAGARVALNRHIGIAEDYANNMRLYEATGVGTCLVTDAKRNLAELFVPGVEVVTYHTAAECAEQVRYLLDHEPERAAMARAGQQRTLRDHTYDARMKELVTIMADTRPRPTTRSTPAVSTGYQPIDRATIPDALTEGWRSTEIPARQRALVEQQLAALERGRPPQVFRVAARAVRATGVAVPTIIELGCASGYYARVFAGLLDRPFHYIGVDYAQPLLVQGRAYDPALVLVGGEASAIPLCDGVADIVFSSALLLHLTDVDEAIRESARLAREWVIFHRTPLLRRTPTTYTRKAAYGVPVLEAIFNRAELAEQIARAGLRVERRFALETYPVHGIAEPVRMTTLVCRRVAHG